MWAWLVDFHMLTWSMYAHSHFYLRCHDGAPHNYSWWSSAECMLSVKVMVGLKQDRCHLQQAALPSLGTSDFDL